jgi:hypothetical protein
MDVSRPAHRRFWVLALALGLGGALAAGASAEEAGRFVLKEAEQNTFIRLDTVTGAVSHCSSRAGEWSCTSVADDRAKLNEEIAKLRRENEELRTRLAQARDDAPDSRLVLPSQEDIDRIMNLFEKYLERFLSFIRKFEEKQHDQAI